MNEQEKLEFKAEIIEEIEKKLKGKVIKEDTQIVLKEPREKWFGASRIKGKMLDIFDSITAWLIWEHVRKITCLICDESYVRQLVGKEEISNEIAEMLCQAIYDLRIQYKEHNRNE